MRIRLAVLLVFILIISAIVIPIATSDKSTDELIAEIKEAFKVYPHIDRSTTLDMLKCAHLAPKGEEGTYYFDLMLGECV